METVDSRVLVRSLLVAVAIFAVTLTLGVVTPLNAASGMLEGLIDSLGPLSSLGPFVLLLLIFANNALKTLGVVVFGPLFGLPPLLFVGLNGFVLGAVVSQVAAIEGMEYVVAVLAPHGVLEVPALLLATALGLMLGRESLRWAARRESHVRLLLSQSLWLYVRVILPVVAVAALIEVVVSPWLAGFLAGG